MVPANLIFVWSPSLFTWSFWTVARLSEPSVYRSLLDALLITPVTKPPLQAIGPSRKSTSALELQKSKRYCPSVVHGWRLGLSRNWLLLQSLFLLSARLKQPACCGLWHEVTNPKSCWFHIFAELICTLALPMVFLQAHRTKQRFPHWHRVPFWETRCCLCCVTNLRGWHRHSQ